MSKLTTTTITTVSVNHKVMGTIHWPSKQGDLFFFYGNPPARPYRWTTTTLRSMLRWIDINYANGDGFAGGEATDNILSVGSKL